jgi:hypothetical protein
MNSSASSSQAASSSCVETPTGWHPLDLPSIWKVGLCPAPCAPGCVGSSDAVCSATSLLQLQFVQDWSGADYESCRVATALQGTEEQAVFRQATPYPLSPTWKARPCCPFACPACRCAAACLGGLGSQLAWHGLLRPQILLLERPLLS